jgi:nucleolin
MKAKKKKKKLQRSL